MASTTRFAGIFALAMSVLVPMLHAQEASRTGDREIDPDAIAALNRMGIYIRTLTAFQIRVETSKEEVLVDGQKVQFAGATDLLAQAPNHLRAEVNSDGAEHRYLYDGKSFTVFDPRVNYYATVPAPATIVELIGRLEDKFGIDIPFADLFRWGGPHSKVGEIQAAGDVGPGQVGGVTCEHYVFRQPGLDWQIWIQLGEYPLPRKLVLTTTTDDARPQFSAVYNWNLAPSFNAETFNFVPPPDAHRIVLREVSSHTEAK